MPAGAAQATDFYVDAATGDDADRGTTLSSAWRTLRKAVDATNVGTVGPGDTVRFGAGTYGALAPAYEVIAASGRPGAPITFQGCPANPKPTILGLVSLQGDDLTASGFVFDGPTGPYRSREGADLEQAPVEIGGDHVALTDSEIRESRSAAGILVGSAKDPAFDFTISRNWIHDNGEFTDTAAANFHHGIYAQFGSGSIANNLIAHNYAYGVHLYPSPSNVLVERNTIVGHGRAGVIVAGADGEPPFPAGNLLVDNILVDNNHAVDALAPIGNGNAALANVLSHNLPPDFHDPSGALTAVRNETGRPRLRVPDDLHETNDLPGPFDGALDIAAVELSCRYPP